MKSILLLLACSCAIAIVSCKKNKQNPPPQPPPVTNETVRVRLRLTGDILTSETTLPNGRKAGTASDYAKTLKDSTLYAVIVKKNNVTFSSGLFNRLDSISVEIPAEGQITIIATAIKRGTGAGVFYTLVNGKQVFDWPFKTTLNNRMDTSVLGRRMQDTLSMQMVNPLDTTKSLDWKTYPEIDAYRGATTFAAIGAPPVLSLNMKRLAFGMQFSSPNFTTGKLIAEFPLLDMQSISVTPANINTQYHIYSTDFFKFTDSLSWGINVQMKWEKPDGSFVPLGGKLIKFKRNVLTKIQVNIVNTGKIDLDPVITETNWSNTEIIDL